MAIQKKLISGLFWVLLLNLLIKPFWILGIEVGVQNVVGVAEYGLYITIFNLAYIFNILLDVGVTSFNTRNIAQHPHLISKHLPAILSLKVMLLALYAVVTFTMGLLKGYDSRHFLLLAFLTFNQFLNSLILYLRSNFEGLLLFRWDSFLSILDRLVMILICGALLWLPSHPHFAIEYFVYAQTAAYLFTAAVALGVLFRRVGIRRLRFSKPFTVAILKQSLPFALLVLLMACYNRIDPLLLEDLAPQGTGLYQAGIYNGAFRLLDAITMIAYLVSVPLLPIYSRLCGEISRGHQEQQAESPQSQLASTTRIVFSAMMVFAITVAIALSALSDQLMGLLYNEAIDQYAAVFRVLIFGIIPISITYVFGTLLTANGSLKQLNILAATTLGVNLVVNLLLIPRIGAVGSAWASLIAQSFMAITQLVIALRIFNMRPSAKYILKLVYFTLVMIGCAHFSSLWSPSLLVYGVIALVMAILTKLIDPYELIKIAKQE